MLKGAVLYAKDLIRLTKFYVAIGGEKTEGNDGEFAVVTSSGSELILLQAPTKIASQIVIQEPPTIRSTTPFKPIIETPSIDDIVLTLLEMGGRPVPDAKPWKFRHYLVQDIVDPEGNVIQLWQPE